MARKKYPMEQIIQHLRTVELEVAKGSTVEEAARKIDILIQSYYRWKKEYTGMDLSQAKKLKELEVENLRLSKIIMTNLMLSSIYKVSFNLIEVYYLQASFK